MTMQMEKTISLRQIRASAIPLACKCPASASDGLRVEFSDDTGEMGTNVHRGISLTLDGEVVPTPSDAEEEAMIALGVAWIRGNFPAHLPVRTELHLEDEYGGGTIDASCIGINVADIADFKTGYRTADDHWPQLYRYAHLYFQKHAGIKFINLNIVWLRNGGMVDTKQVTRAYIMRWWEEFVRNVLNHPDVYSPGEHCSRCQRRIDCVALGEINRGTALAIMAEPGQLTVTRDDMARMRPRVKMLAAIIKQYDEAVRREVIENGPIPLDGEKELRAVTNRVEKIGILPAWEILQEKFTDAELGEFVTVTKGAMLDLVAAKVAKGKGKAKDEFMDKLRAAGAVCENEVIQVKEVSTKETV